MFKGGWISGEKEAPLKKVIASLVLAAFVAAPGPAAGRERPRSQQPAAGRIVVGMPARLDYREITLVLRDGTVVLGRLLGADTDSVRIYQGGPDLDVPFRDIKKAVLTVDGKSSRGVLPGVVTGLYLGNGLIFGAFSHPGNYMRRLGIDSKYAGLALLYFSFLEVASAAAGGGLGAAFASGTRHRTFEFPADPETSGESRGRFLRFIGGEPEPARVHVLIQGGWVSPAVSRTFESALADAGFTTRFFPDELSSFSLLRSFELSYSLKPRMRTGVRISFPGEPKNEAWVEDPLSNFISVSQEFRATAFHAVCSIEPLGRKPSGPWSWSVGLGVGAAAVRLRREMLAYRDNVYITSEAETKKTLPSAVAFTTLRIRLNEILTAGIAADCTFIPAATVPGLSDLGLSAEKVGLSNASVGFVLGYHF